MNLDFQDLRSVIENGGGVAMIGLGEASGEDCAERATDEALESPLLEIDISDARGALVNVVGGPTLSLGDAEPLRSVDSRPNQPLCTNHLGCNYRSIDGR